MIARDEIRSAKPAEQRESAFRQRLLIISSLDVSRIGLRVLIGSLSNSLSIRESPCLSVLPKMGNDVDLILLDLFSDRQQKDDLASLIEYPLLTHRMLAVLGPNFPEPQQHQLFQADIGGIIEQHRRQGEWQEAVHAILEGKTYYSRRVRAERFPARLPSGRPDTPHPLSSLSPREVEIFQCIGCGRSTQQMAEKLGLSSKTIETYREHTKRKLKLRNASELTCSARLWVEQGVIGQKTGPEAPRANGH